VTGHLGRTCSTAALRVGDHVGVNEKQRRGLLRRAEAELQQRNQQHGWGSAEASAARQRLLDLQRSTAAEMGLPYAAPLDLGVTWDAGAPLPFLVAGRRTFVAFYPSDTDPALDGLDPDYIGPQRGVGVAEFHLATSVKMGSPNDEVLHGHPLWGYGLELYGAHVVANSPWIKELMGINRVHEQFSESRWTDKRHYLLAFHDETVECVARGVAAWVDLATMSDVIGRLSRDAL